MVYTEASYIQTRGMGSLELAQYTVSVVLRALLQTQVMVKQSSAF